jgi:hypothetical protein
MQTQTCDGSLYVIYLYDIRRRFVCYDIVLGVFNLFHSIIALHGEVFDTPFSCTHITLFYPPKLAATFTACQLYVMSV